MLGRGGPEEDQNVAWGYSILSWFDQGILSVASFFPVFFSFVCACVCTSARQQSRAGGQRTRAACVELLFRSGAFDGLLAIGGVDEQCSALIMTPHAARTFC